MMSNTVYGECTLEERRRPRVWIALVVSLLMGAMEPVLSMILRWEASFRGGGRETSQARQCKQGDTSQIDLVSDRH